MTGEEFLNVYEGYRSPGRWRKAWCELTGGHDNGVWGTFTAVDTDIAASVSLECQRCGKRTVWYRVPRRGAPPRNPNDGD